MTIELIDEPKTREERFTRSRNAHRVLPQYLFNQLKRFNVRLYNQLNLRQIESTLNEPKRYYNPHTGMPQMPSRKPNVYCQESPDYLMLQIDSKTYWFSVTK